MKVFGSLRRNATGVSPNTTQCPRALSFAFGWISRNATGVALVGGGGCVRRCCVGCVRPILSRRPQARTAGADCRAARDVAHTAFLTAGHADRRTRR